MWNACATLKVAGPNGIFLKSICCISEYLDVFLPSFQPPICVLHIAIRLRMHPNTGRTCCAILYQDVRSFRREEHLVKTQKTDFTCSANLGCLVESLPGLQVVFMDSATYEEARVKPEDAWSKWVKEGDTVNLVVWNGKVITVEIPKTVTLLIAEAGPGVQGSRSSAGSKSIKLETGAIIQVQNSTVKFFSYAEGFPVVSRPLTQVGQASLEIDGKQMTDPLFRTFADHPCMISASRVCYVEIPPTSLASMAKAGWHGLSADLCKFWSIFKLTMLCIFNAKQM